MTSTSPTKIAIVGAAGTVGSSIAFSLILNPIAGQIILSDPQTDVVKAQAEDLRDAILQSDTTSTRVHVAEDPKEAGQADIIIITAGAAQKKGESRTDLVGKNAKILKSVAESLGQVRKEAVVLVVANPVDVMTYFAQKFIDLPKGQVFGSGTFLDSARLKGKLAEQIGVSQSNVEAFVLGEHGESQVVAWSAVSVGGVALDRIEKDIDRQQVADQTRDKAGAIIDAKGTTNYGIGAVASSICKAILFDQRVIRPVSHWQEDLGVCLSMPAVLGRSGLIQSIPLPLSDEETEKVRKSAQSLKEVNEEANKAIESG
ncbi:Putative lactate/malate dehydrogenase, lactate dehydrogenase/glycoside hydrolase, family 4 [Septoria linicola]|uniref:Lactate/malate dehydrogenase, lactate dehydrogenase/glycoside hydrolase, family 4 n=1 Tax=Septoria linicola TaxID=215465 RepID=A0A9Q9ANS5_9PEZI|nr:putative lactate/malate dehydrogenase, lactate dehydrogenase/glycoside hydrolase, family 4 [Septoria linicola]USW52355.1 Putative lactate/malate dehydrogenase, lactate dehydrogenase/glycoside hydrolase, family 4 [Septoria linicola]